MVHNAATPHIEVDPETYEVRADGELLTCEPAERLPLAQRYFLYKPPCLDYVGIDLSDAAVAAVRHLVEPGRRRSPIWCMTWHIAPKIRDTRRIGYARTKLSRGACIDSRCRRSLSENCKSVLISSIDGRVCSCL